MTLRLLHYGSGLCLTALLAGCNLVPSLNSPAPTSGIARPDPSLSVVADHLEAMWRLNHSSPAEQAELFQVIRDTAELTPTTANRLRYALALGTPGHGAAAPELARQKLTEVLAIPQALLPAERALAWITLRNVEQRQILQAEVSRLQTELARRGRDRNTATNKRLQEEIDENERLSKELAEAQAKLDEITKIERSIIERTPPKNGR